MKGLEALEYQMARNLESLTQRRESTRFSKTFKGKIFNWGGRLFGVYCIFRVVSVRLAIFLSCTVLIQIGSVDHQYLRTSTIPKFIIDNISRCDHTLPDVHIVAPLAHRNRR